MDFHTLARRDLQALCKKNKIPANITNVAMADALKALKLVEGIEEFMQQSQSGTTQSSIDSLETPEVTSPFVPPTAGRSTRRTNIPKPAPESVNPMTRTRRTARKTQVKDADAIETPAMVPQTNRKKVTMASARLNMDSQLKECADEGKKDFLTTPAAGVTSRRKKAEESTVTRAYSTRRSTRLAEKSSVEISNEVSKDGENEEKMDLKDGVDNFNELSGITDGDAITTVEEKTENKEEFEVVSIGEDEFEVVSDQKQDTSIVQDEFEVVSEQKHDTSIIGEEIKMGSYAEEEMCDNEEMQLNDSNEVQQNDGSEIEITVEKSSEELGFEEGETTEDEAAATEFVESVIIDSGDNFVVDEFYFDNIGSHDEIKEELSSDIVDGGSKDVTDLNVTLGKLTELTLQQALTQEADSDFIDHFDIPEQQLNEDEAKESDKAAADPVPLETEPIEIDTLQNVESEKADEPNVDMDVIETTLPSGFEGLENEPTEIETLQIEESEKDDEPCADMDVIENTLPSGFEGLENEPTEISEQIPTSDMDVIENEPTEIEILEPEDIEKAVDFSEQIPTTKSSTVCFSDNKENIGGNLVIMKDAKMAEKSVKNVDLGDLSVRQLTKMLKEKLEITKKSSKTADGNDAEMPRTALQVVSENRMVDGAGN
ncbi:hypothetical protein PHJA_002362700 [Phtheirospermum japonicum]|uniref:Uncharacterized protein n=1 Tax=Phtheirospermum japonicum TaxID=374723 RepID=A0A830CNK8_9LAMI|nr:hypothetical protein PHJA_002362700 [Phtheirospermum japonicum]